MSLPQAALRVCSGPTVSSAVTAVMAVCVMLPLVTVPAASGGPARAAMKVTHNALTSVEVSVKQLF